MNPRIEVTKHCESCGKLLTRKGADTAAALRKRRYCSGKCRWQHHRKIHGDHRIAHGHHENYYQEKREIHR